MKKMMNKQMDIVNVNELNQHQHLELIQNDEENLKENYLFAKKYVVI
jgi:hypothetical protein